MRLAFPATLAALLMAASAPVLAQGTGGGMGAGANTAAPAAVGGAMTAITAGQMRAKDLMGRDVHASDGAELGEVEDLVLDPGTGRITAVVVEVEGTLGIGGRHVALPLDRLRIGGDRRLSLGMTRDEFGALPDFRYRD